MNNRILVIDDEPDILSTLEMTLSQDYFVATANGGEAGLALFRQQPFDLVITDMRMPGMDGVEVIRQVKALNPDVEVVMLTGYATLENAVMSLRNAGAFDYLTKPLENIDELFMAVEKGLEKRRLTLENRILLQTLKEKEAELAQQNQALRESELLKQAILDGISSTLCFVFNQNLEVLWANRAAGEASNLSMDELVGRKCFEIWERESAPRPECPLVKAQKSGKSEQSIIHYPNDRIMHVRAEPVIDDKGLLLGLLRIGDDITEKALAENALRESERKYRELADSLPVSLFETDEKGAVTFLNPFALDQMQYTREDLREGLHIRDMVEFNQWEIFREKVRKLMSEKLLETTEFVAKRKDGTTFPVLVNVRPVLENNEHSGLRGLALDITERKQRLEEMTRMAKLESLGTLAGGIAHDFNNLLTIILGNIEIAEWDMPPETPSAKALKIAREGCLSATALTGQFITFSKGGAPKMKVSAIEKFLRDTVHLFLSGSNVNCAYDISENLVSVEMDEQQMRQVTQNLIQNAIEAMPEGGSIQVRAENMTLTENEQRPVPEMPEGRYVKLEFQDEGNGIPEEDKIKVFDPYFSTKSRGAQKGMGLGLTTALSIVRKHGGFMRLESKANSGSTVSIYLPAVHHNEKEVAVVPETSFLKGTALSKYPKILVMDDEKMLRELAEKMLRRIGYRVETAGNGKEAVEMYQKALESTEPFDLVMLDLTVKGGPGGKEAIKELLRLNPDVKAIVCSGYGDHPVMSNYKEYGFRSALAKPFSKASLEETLKTVLGRDNR